MAKEKYKFDPEKIKIARDALPFLRGLYGDALSSILDIILTMCGQKPGTNIHFGWPPFDLKVDYSDVSNLIKKLKEIFSKAGLRISVSKNLKDERKWYVLIYLFNKEDELRYVLAKKLVRYTKVFLGRSDLPPKQKKNFDTISGEFYGYPQCCIYYILGKKQTSRFLYSKYSGFISHISCTADCKESIEMAERYASCIKEVSPELYKEILERGNNLSETEIEYRKSFPRAYGGSGTIG